MAASRLDHLDRRLVDTLALNARVSHRKIAAGLGVTEGTVRGRIRRLQDEGLITITAITSFDMAESSRLAFISAQADVDKVRQVAEQIVQLPLINGVLLTMGEINITVLCLFRDLSDPVDTASDQILAMPGVQHVETSIAVKTIKYSAKMDCSAKGFLSGPYDMRTALDEVAQMMGELAYMTCPPASRCARAARL